MHQNNILGRIEEKTHKKLIPFRLIVLMLLGTGSFAIDKFDRISNQDIQANAEYMHQNYSLLTEFDHFVNSALNMSFTAEADSSEESLEMNEEIYSQFRVLTGSVHDLEANLEQLEESGIFELTSEEKQLMEESIQQIQQISEFLKSLDDNSQLTREQLLAFQHLTDLAFRNIRNTLNTITNYILAQSTEIKKLDKLNFIFNTLLSIYCLIGIGRIYTVKKISGQQEIQYKIAPNAYNQNFTNTIPEL